MTLFIYVDETTTSQNIVTSTMNIGKTDIFLLSYLTG